MGSLLEILSLGPSPHLLSLTFAWRPHWSAEAFSGLRRSLKAPCLLLCPRPPSSTGTCPTDACVSSPDLGAPNDLGQGDLDKQGDKGWAQSGGRGWAF